MKILFASSEVAPYSKTGGLADVAGALPIALAELGHEVVVVTPAYSHVHRCGAAIQPTHHIFDIPIGSKVVSGRLLESRLPGSQVPIYFVEQSDYFDRPELYRESGEDYKDNCERFTFFSRATLEMIRVLDLHVDVLHCNDWQTGLIPAYLRIEYEHAARYEHIVSLMTIHNLAYQGQFWHWDMLLTGLDWKYFHWRQMEFWGRLNLLKTGIVFADAISTVSPRYSREIQTDTLGCGLEGVLSQRSEELHGIINGVDYSVWSPDSDPHLPKNYDVSTWREGKSACKAKLQDEFGLPVSDAPLVGLVGRLADQKGWDLVAEVMERWIHSTNVQWAILGTGEPQYHALLRKLAAAAPEKVAARLEFSDRLAHLVEAGSDMFLMPSQYEPCGLNQLYSLRYGTVPVVRDTGGLSDTICDSDQESLANGTANGFKFAHYDVSALEEVLRRACSLFEQQPATWGQIVETGMRQDWSWKQSARSYGEIYERLMSKHESRRGKTAPASS